MTKFEITRAAELSTLADFRRFIDNTCQQMRIDHETCLELTLAVDEACTNVIEHGYAGMNAGSIILSLQFEAHQAIIEITDFGHPFEPYEPATPDAAAILEDQESGGFGLHIIYQTMDDIFYEADNFSNRLTFIKYLKQS